MPLKNRDGSPMFLAPRPPLPPGTARFVGEACLWGAGVLFDALGLPAPAFREAKTAAFLASRSASRSGSAGS